jgi:hypothetical protein
VSFPSVFGAAILYESPSKDARPWRDRKIIFYEAEKFIIRPYSRTFIVQDAFIFGFSAIHCTGAAASKNPSLSSQKINPSIQQFGTHRLLLEWRMN